MFMSGDLRYLLLPYDTLVVILYLMLLSMIKTRTILNFSHPIGNTEMVHCILGVSI